MSRSVNEFEPSPLRVLCPECEVVVTLQKSSVIPMTWIESWSIALDCDPTPNAVGEAIRELRRENRILRMRAAPVFVSPNYD